MRSACTRHLVVAVLLPLVTACPRDKSANDAFVAVDAKQALEESALDAQGQAIASDIVEISTSFTIGEALESAAEEVENFVVSQIPCAKVVRSGGTATIDFGVRGSGCFYHGRAVSGQSRVTIARNDASAVTVEHEWTRLSNGVVEVNGAATVTYELAIPSRHVEHDVAVTRLSDGFVIEGQGDRVQKPLAEGLSVGVEVNGTRDWGSVRGTSELIIDGVQMRWSDPVPQAGVYRLLTQKHHEVSLSFSRKDGDTISVSVASGGREFRFDVSKTGSVRQLAQ
jgi:hypothetical protein